MATFLIVLLFAGILAALGITEKIHNDRNVNAIQLRINVNGIRGKSTATRLITAILKEDGYRVVGKTTGTAARILYWDKDEEEEIVRPPSGPNISEQIHIIDKAVKHNADALVCECMAVRPEYQRVCQDQIIKAQITIITNVLEDHLDDMGPTTKEIAAAFAQTIPYNGLVIVPDCEYTEEFEYVAKQRGSEFIIIDDDKVTQSYLDQFDYKLFPHNCAVALAVADALGIDEDTAKNAMLKAAPDPGALRFYKQNLPETEYCVVNAFAANDPHSTLEIWENAKLEEPALAQKPLIIMNCREDRIDRTKQLVGDCVPFIPNSTLCITGNGTDKAVQAYKQRRLKNVVEFVDLSEEDPEKAAKTIYSMVAGHLVLCIGNVHGGGQEILDYIIGKQAEEKAANSTVQKKEKTGQKNKNQTGNNKRIHKKYKRKHKKAIRQAKKNMKNIHRQQKRKQKTKGRHK